MSEILSRFRITSSAFERPFENTEDKSQPNFVYFLSVEGDDTEKDYFTGSSAKEVKRSDANLDFPRRQVHDLELEVLEVA